MFCKVLQNQKVLSAYFQSEQMMFSGFARQNNPHYFPCSPMFYVRSDLACPMLFVVRVPCSCALLSYVKLRENGRVCVRRAVGVQGGQGVIGEAGQLTGYKRSRPDPRRDPGN